MAIWLTKQRAQMGPVFGFIDKFEGLGIFIDTYKNDRPGVVFPYIMAMMGDGKTAYDKDHDGKANELAGCPAHNVRNGANPSRIKIRYFHERSLEVTIATDADHKKWEPCFTLPNIKIPNVAYLGLSAETGELSDNHDLLWLETRNLYELDPHKGGNAATEKGKKGKKRKQKGSGSGWGGFFLKAFVLFIMVVVVWVLYVVFRSQKSRSRF